MMTDIIRLRETTVKFFRNYENIILSALKFFAGLILFGRINSLGFYRDGFAGFAGGGAWTFGLSVLFAVAPPTAAHLVLLLAVMVQISLSLELTLVVFLIGVCILVFYCRMEPQKSFLITAMILGVLFQNTLRGGSYRRVVCGFFRNNPRCHRHGGVQFHTHVRRINEPKPDPGSGGF
jgi:glycerol-3-phosphate acyltransferase PlsY